MGGMLNIGGGWVFNISMTGLSGLGTLIKVCCLGVYGIA